MLFLISSLKAKISQLYPSFFEKQLLRSMKIVSILSIAFGKAAIKLKERLYKAALKLEKAGKKLSKA